MWFWVQSVPQNIVEEVFLYGSTVLIGGGGATILVTSLSMVADLIGPAVVIMYTCTVGLYGLPIWFLETLNRGPLKEVTLCVH